MMSVEKSMIYFVIVDFEYHILTVVRESRANKSMTVAVLHKNKNKNKNTFIFEITMYTIRFTNIHNI